MRTVPYLIISVVGFLTNIAHAGDIKTDFSSSVWVNMLNIPEILVRVKNPSRFSDTDVCFSAGKYSEKIRNNLFQVAYRLDPNFNEYQSLSGVVGERGAFNAAIISNALENISIKMMDRCEGKLDRTALNDDLIKLYKGHIAIYRILEPSDVNRAISNLNNLEILSPDEKKRILAPVTNTSELDNFPNQLK